MNHHGSIKGENELLRKSNDLLSSVIPIEKLLTWEHDSWRVTYSLTHPKGAAQRLGQYKLVGTGAAPLIRSMAALLGYAGVVSHVTVTVPESLIRELGEMHDEYR